MATNPWTTQYFRNAFSLASGGVAPTTVAFADTGKYTGPAKDFAVGEIYGLRYWKVDGYGRLRARNIEYAPPWRPGENTAVCQRYPDIPGTPRPEHTAPDPRCTCGYYAYTDVDHGRADAEAYNVMPYGVIRAYGTVLVGTRGFRAQKAEIVALRIPKRIDNRAAIERAYPDIPVLGSRRELLEFAPIESSLPCPDTEEFWKLP